MSDYLGRNIRFRTDPLDLWEHGKVVQELPSSISGETNRLVVLLDLRQSGTPGVLTTSRVAIIWLHLKQIDVLNPMVPDYERLGAEEPTSQIQDARDAAGI